VQLVGRVTGKSGDDLNRMLANLQSAEFIYEQPAMGDVEYAFKHTLTQEVAYGSILMERRKLLHERVGQGDRDAVQPSAGRPVQRARASLRRSANREKAFDYARLAGKTCNSSFCPIRGGTRDGSSPGAGCARSQGPRPRHPAALASRRVGLSSWLSSAIPRCCTGGMLEKHQSGLKTAACYTVSF